jgi:protein gp37
VIVGGESGPRARPIEADWVRNIRDQCVVNNVPFFFKQWGNAIDFSGPGARKHGGTKDNYLEA